MRISTLKDVARHAGVSVKTVSNVVNGYPYISADMRRRVQAAIEELNYRPNPTARHLRAGRTGLLALVVTGTGVPYLDDLAVDVVAAAADRGYRVVVERGDLAAIGAARPMAVDGVLLAADGTPPEPIQAQAAAGTPLVRLGETRDGHGDHVAIDHARAARDATEHLLRAGRRTVAAIGGHPDQSPAAPGPRTAGYRQALRRSGLAPRPGDEQPVRWHRRAEGRRDGRALLAGPAPPDAIFCHSDLLAIGAVRAVVDAGLRVPDDVAVVGIGDIEEGRYSRPALSTVAVDTAFIAREAVARIAARGDQPDAEPVEITAPHAVRPRESSGAATPAGRPLPG
ncbi:LacI family DNA-binding transcriptional regulator [Micromonospora coerulea]|uniref:LacI family DNA-binding transcriptional regulator n=1 Tax=Micromonospora coerulea TaxID=47856 RepID=A0ABP8SAB3_9ACTN